MKVLVLLVLSLIGASQELSVSHIIKDFEDASDTLAKKCYQDFQITRAQVDVAVEMEELPTDRSFKCFLNCVAVELKIVDESANLQILNAQKYLEMDVDKASAIINECRNTDGDDSCEKVYHMLNCAHKVEQFKSNTPWKPEKNVITLITKINSTCKSVENVQLLSIYTMGYSALPIFREYKPGFSLSDALDIIFAYDDIANQVDEVFIEPPETTVDTDENSAEEDQGGMFHNLTGRQLRAPVEIRLIDNTRINTNKHESVSSSDRPQNMEKIVDDFEDSLDKNAPDCYKQFNYNRKKVDPIFRSPTLPSDSSFNCFLNCVGKSLTLLDASGNYKEESIKKYLETDDIIATKIIVECKDVKGSDECETAYEKLNCVHSKFRKQQGSL
ncbi:hypothetical protein FQA39_LY16576 [Lamprigera yunnana]|nr:hypothetical protein FQA39_LY16576 [Lamprigera yunnana]